MKKLGLCVLLSVALCGGAARAGEFLMLQVTVDNDDPFMTITDSSSIMATAAGHKIATFDYIYEFDEWSETKVDLDCTAERWRELGGVHHDMDGSVSPQSPEDDWVSFDPGTVGADMHDTVCGWPDKRPDPDLILNGEIPEIIERASAAVSKLADQAKPNGNK